MGRIPALDGIRAIAILLVIAHHAVSFDTGVATTPLEDQVQRVAGEGWIGVDLFFVLSGYLISGILLREKGRRGYWRNFMARRVLRIFPAYYLFLVVFFVVLPRLFPAHPGIARLPEQQIWYWLYVPNVRIFLHGNWDAVYVEHAWSLAIEEQFYLVWPLVVALCSRRALVALCAVLVPASMVLRIVLVSGGAGRAVAFALPPTHFDGLMLGAMLAALEPALARAPGRGRAWLLAAGGLGALVLATVFRLPWSHDMKHLTVAVTGWSLLFVAATGWTLTLGERSLAVRILSFGPLRRIGTYSYGLYLWHQPIFRALEEHQDLIGGPALRRWTVLFLAGGAISVAVAALLYHAFEMRFLALKRYFEGPHTAKI